MRFAMGDLLSRAPAASSRESSARRMAASQRAPNSGTSVAPSSPVAERTVSRHSARARRAKGPRRRAAARSRGFVSRGHFCLTGTFAAISTMGPRSSTSPALTTSETLRETSTGSREAGDPGAETLPPAGQRCMSTSRSAAERYSMRSKTSSSLVASLCPGGWMMARSIWDAAPSQTFLADAISRSSVTPLNTTMRVDGRCLTAPSLSSSMSRAMVRIARSLSRAGPK
mmetsp:Transcript_22079/g.47390  ORF Transcript_22079/g.47390 Transcript_22079/m.47390 type:complete len:228 (-) Transcript_22079:615-1298(-)